MKSTEEEINLKDILKAIRALRKELNSIKQSMAMEQKTFFTNKEVMDILNVSPNTLKKWRDEGYLGYSQINSKFMYSKEDIGNLLKDSHYESFRRYKDAVNY